MWSLLSVGGAGGVTVRPGGAGGGDRAAFGPFPLDLAFQALDLGALLWSPSVPGDESREQAQQAVEAEQQGRADPARAAVDGGGQQRGEPGHDRRALIRQRRAGGAGLGGETLGEPGSLSTGQ